MKQVISIIVPVYNCKKYLSKCIESIIMQSYPYIQLILVDDGSTDGSGEICDAFAVQDNRITVRHQRNGGVSRARNEGMELATGEWLLFVDSDDYVSLDYCHRMLVAAQRCDAEVVIARPTNLSLEDMLCYEAEQIELLKQACLAYDETKFNYNIDGPWGKLFSRSIVQQYDIRFPENLARSEDAYFCATVYEYTSHICWLNWFGYYHVEREGSLCRRFAPDAPEMLEQILRENKKWVQKYHFGESAYEVALCHRVLPGIDECEKLYFLHEANGESVWKKMRSYSFFLNNRLISQAIKQLKVTDVAKRQYQIRLVFYKLHLGWLFLLLKYMGMKR